LIPYLEQDNFRFGLFLVAILLVRQQKTLKNPLNPSFWNLRKV
jgi:hypothetical protein